ncbi:MAG: PrsW family intramembrane metalloprotease [Candidatus Micrarchaeota archaeon]|nr:PrsW family intramembrane metalloprotease [Candidatus Micrarchaeota archaeon]
MHLKSNSISTSLIIQFILISTVLAFPNQLIIHENKSIVKGQLNAEINPIGIVCTENPCLITHNVTISNEENKTVSVALYRKDDNKYNLMAVLGNLSGYETAEFQIPIKYNYNGVTTYVGRYMLITDNYLVKEFTIAESWNKYEKTAYDALDIGAYVISPIIALVLLFILSLVVRNAEMRRYGKKDEYTDKTLFEFPYGKTPGEQIANAMTNPIIWSLILFFAVLLVCLVTFSTYQNYDIITKMEIIVISFVAALVIPIILMIFTWYADIYEREPLRFVVGMFVYGIFAALIAFFLNNLIMYLAGKGPEMIPLALMTAIISIVASPIIEEFLKLFGLALFSRHHEFDDALDGLLYGFAIGIGFAMYENWFYFVGNLDPLTSGIDSWISIIVYRSFFNTLAHGCFVAFAGMLLGYLKSRENYRPYYHFGLIPGLFVAILLHLIFNITAYLDIVNIGGYRAIVASYNPSFVIAISIVFIISYIFAAIDTKKNRATQQEVA